MGKLYTLFKNRPINKIFISSFLLSFAFFSVFTLKSFADQYVVKPSITMTSSNTSYENNEPGSWQMKKSAKWIARNKAQIKFEVDSSKTSENDLDVLFVLDNSGSMGGDPLTKIKADANEAIDAILANSNNRISLVTFESTSQILSNWSNDANNLKSLVNGISDASMTNYYSGLINAEKILDGTAPGGTGSPYQKQADRDLVMVFMSDGQPNERTPNEIAEYKLIKQTYPYITINAIQYNMGEDFILDPLKAISDNQFISNSYSTANILLEATIVPFFYDEFVLEDQLNDDYWDGATIDKITQILGGSTIQNTGTLNPSNVAINKTSTPPTIKWDLSGIYRSGSKATLTLEVTLKDQYKDQGGLFPTNKGTSITTKLEDTPDEDETTTDTPVLSSDYKVHYDANKPTGCTLGGDSIPQDSNHIVFSTVEIDSGIPTCTNPNNPADNYEFKGWEIVEPEDPADETKTLPVEKIGSDYFVMPSADVTLKAIWVKPSISKAMDGEVVEGIPAYLDTGQRVNQKMKSLAGNSNPGFYTENTNIKAIKSASSLPANFAPTTTNTVSTYDSPLPIYMWFDDTNDQGIIYYYTDAVANIYLNNDSIAMFYKCTSLTDLSGLANWSTSAVTKMNNMFAYCTSLTDLTPLSGWSTSSVTNMLGVFSYCTSLTDLTPLSGWSTSSVTNMSAMFSVCTSLTDLSGLANWNTSSVTDMHSMFADCYSLTDLTPLSGWNTSSVTDMSYMFSGEEHASYMNITDLTPLSDWTTSSVTDMSRMFSYCTSLTDLTPLAGWNTSSVYNISRMFYLDNQVDGTVLNGWDVYNVGEMDDVFSCPADKYPSWY